MRYFPLMSSRKLSIIFTLLFFSSSLIWFIFPTFNLEPFLVFVTAALAIERLYDTYFRQKLAEWRTERQDFTYLKSSQKVNAVEGCFQNFSSGIELILRPQSIKHTPNKLEVYFNQTSLDLRATFDNGTTSKPFYKFDIGYESEEEYAFEKVTNKYFLVQYDIDKDGLDEYIFGVIDGRDIEINVIKFFPPLREKDLNRRANWSVVERLRADFILPDPPVVEIIDNTIVIQRGHRGFYYKWLFTEQEVADVSYM